jgi:hypothetical protein
MAKISFCERVFDLLILVIGHEMDGMSGSPAGDGDTMGAPHQRRAIRG